MIRPSDDELAKAADAVEDLMRRVTEAKNRGSDEALVLASKALAIIIEMQERDPETFSGAQALREKALAILSRIDDTAFNA